MVEDKSKIAAMNKFTLYLKSKKLRKTPERYAILDRVLSINEHFDIETLYRFLEDDSYHVSRATVYNTMELLTDSGIVSKLQFGNQQAQYERVINAGNHHHLLCTECGKIKEVKDPDFIAYMNARKYPAFATSYFQLYVYGICNSCARKMKRCQKETMKK